MGIKGLAKLLSDEAPDVRSVADAVSYGCCMVSRRRVLALLSLSLTLSLSHSSLSLSL